MTDQGNVPDFFPEHILPFSKNPVEHVVGAVGAGVHWGLGDDGGDGIAIEMVLKFDEGAHVYFLTAPAAEHLLTELKDAFGRIEAERGARTVPPSVPPSPSENRE